MVYYTHPPGITRAMVDAQEEAVGAYVFPPDTLFPKAFPSNASVCSRCVYHIASDGNRCAKPELKACGRCSKIRQPCTPLPDIFNGRVLHLLQLRQAWAISYQATTDPENDADTIAAGVRLASAQATFSLTFQKYRTETSRARSTLSVFSTPTPQATPDVMGLMLAEMRNQTAQQAQMVQALVASAEAIKSMATALHRMERTARSPLVLRREEIEEDNGELEEV